MMELKRPTVDLEVALFDLVNLCPSRITADAGSKVNPLAVLDAEAYHVLIPQTEILWAPILDRFESFPWTITPFSAGESRFW
jgi:hypothetical protein